MTRVTTTRLAWSLWALMLVLLVCSATLNVLWGVLGEDQSAGASISLGALGVVFGTVGAIVAWRVPRTPVGWMFLAIGVLGSGLIDVAREIAYQGLVVDPGSIPGAVAAAWFYSWAWYPGIALIGFVPFVYPDARLPARWRRITLSLVAVSCVMTVVIMLNPGPLDGDASALPDNPLGVDALDALPGGDALVVASLLLVFGGGAASAIARYRRSRGDERQQMKLMAFAAAIMVVALFAPSFTGLGSSDYVFAAVVTLLPVSLGVAILRYRLYDVDRVVSRTLVYAVLTVILAATYVALVLAGQWVFSSFAGGSDLAIAASTLVVAALFLPVRSRVQAFVDRRFYRRRYDAQRTLEAFGARLREQVDLGTLTGELRGVVHETMQPAHVSVWLRERQA
jgi:hypothetical protein